MCLVVNETEGRVPSKSTNGEVEICGSRKIGAEHVEEKNVEEQLRIQAAESNRRSKAGSLLVCVPKNMSSIMIPFQGFC